MGCHRDDFENDFYMLQTFPGASPLIAQIYSKFAESAGAWFVG